MYGLETLRNDIDEYKPEQGCIGIDIWVNSVDGPWTLPMLIFKDLKNQLRMWEIRFDGVHLITLHGTMDGQKQEVKRLIVTNNSGKDVYSQALLEGKKRYQDKIREGYHRVGMDTEFRKPMLAAPYDKHFKKILGNFDIVCQYKIDGIRALTSHTSLGIVRLTRTNNAIQFQEHLDMDCYNLLSYLPGGTIIDGELYKHGMPFEEITSRCSVGRKEPHYDREVIEYWIFDIITVEPMSYMNRYNMLCDAYNLCAGSGKIILMPVFTCPGNLTSITAQLEQAVSYGYEGIMIKNPTSNYIHGRTCNLLKVKDFNDEEGIVMRVISGSGTEEGCAIFILYDNLTCKEFPVRPKGTFDQRRYWYSNPNTVIGKYYTYKYFGHRTPGQLPRFPVGLRFREELV
jgi:DNA ligase-1